MRRHMKTMQKKLFFDQVQKIYMKILFCIVYILCAIIQHNMILQTGKKELVCSVELHKLFRISFYKKIVVRIEGPANPICACDVPYLNH